MVRAVSRTHHDVAMPVRRYDACFPTPRDDLFVIAGLNADHSAISNIDLQPRPVDVYPHAVPPPVLATLASWLGAYFADPAATFDLPLDPSGTPFQRDVWRQLHVIEVGRTRCYGDIAQRLRTSARAVGNACRANPIALIVPCHRVVSIQGLGGYAGATSGWKLSVKKWLLEHEQRRAR